uniref:GAD-like domain-containing protein n=1 Tax=Steinernema glaseri TaxID=37863 RepID=A0A1I7ZCU6_9BILA
MWLQGTEFEKLDTYHVIGRTAFGDLYAWGETYGRKLIVLCAYNRVYAMSSEKNVPCSNPDLELQSFLSMVEREDFDMEDADGEFLFERALQALGPLGEQELSVAERMTLLDDWIACREGRVVLDSSHFLGLFKEHGSDAELAQIFAGFAQADALQARAQQARYCLSTQGPWPEQAHWQPVVEVVSREVALKALQSDAPNAWVFEHFADTVIEDVRDSQLPMYALLEALYGIAADYYLAWTGCWWPVDRHQQSRHRRRTGPHRLPKPPALPVDSPAPRTCAVDRSSVERIENESLG